MSQGLGIYKYTSTACGKSPLLQSVCLQIQGPGFDSQLGQVKYFRSTTLIYCLLLLFVTSHEILGPNEVPGRN